MNLLLVVAILGSTLFVAGSDIHGGDFATFHRSHDSAIVEGLNNGDLHERHKRWIAIAARAIAALKGTRALNKMLKGTKPGKNKPSKSVKEHHKDGDFNDAVDVHKSLGGKPEPIKGPNTNGFTSKVGDRTFTVRDNSNSGKATIESFKTNSKKGKDRVTDKVRFNGDKKDTGSGGSSSKSGGGGSWWRRKRAARMRQ